MSRLIVLVFVMASSLLIAQEMPDSTLFEKHLHIDGSDSLPYLLYRSQRADTADETPALVVFLHGAGERGNDNYSQLRHCVKYFVSDSISNRYSFVLMLPQCPEGRRWAETDWRLPSHQMDSTPSVSMQGVVALIDSMKTSLSIDSNRIYICGISMGGFGVWDALQRCPDRFAAAIAICGGGDPAYASRMKDMPLYIFHGDKDKLVKPIRSRQMYQALRKMHSRDLHYVHYSDLGHFCWDRAFSTPGIFQWFFSKKRQ